MSVKIYNEFGLIEYSDEVLTSIIGIAAMECYGVVGMASKRASDGFWELLKRDSLGKGVKIENDGENIIVNVFIIVEYGTKISVIADNIMQRVKYTVETLTGLNVSKIKVNIQGVRV